MAIALEGIRRNSADSLKPSIQYFYAEDGLGKTSYAAGAPDPIFLQTEDGLGKIEADTFGMLESYNEFYDKMIQLYERDHSYRTVVVDSVTWLEKLIWAKVRADNKMSEDEFHHFGRGYKPALRVWINTFDGLRALRNERNMTVIILGHVHIKKVEPPDLPSYTRYTPMLQELASDMLRQYVDETLFMEQRVSVTQEEPNTKGSRNMGIGGRTRIVHTRKSPAHVAKNRWQDEMPAEIRMPDVPEQMFPTVAQYIPYYRKLMAQPAQLPAQQPTPILADEAA